MITRNPAESVISRFWRNAIGLLLLLSLLLTSAAYSVAEGSALQGRTIRVGYMNHPGFIEKKDDGIFYGYGVEYLKDICTYGDWNIEYVYASWPD